MRSTADFVWLAIYIAAALVVLTRSGGFQSKTYRRANVAGVIAWIAVILLGIWVARRIILPIFLDL